MPDDLITHLVVTLSTRRIWRRGQIQDKNEDSVPARLLRRLDRLGTPRLAMCAAADVLISLTDCAESCMP